MKRICLDTTAYTHFKRGVPGVVGIVRTARAVLVPAVVIAELRTGFKLGSRAEENEAALKLFLENPVVSVAEIDEEAAAVFADLVVELRREGTLIPTNDIWIAALAIREGVTLLTFKSHFADLQRLGTSILPKPRESTLPPPPG